MTAPGDAAPPSPLPPAKRRRRFRQLVIAAIVLLVPCIAFVALLPAILNTELVGSYVLDRINRNYFVGRVIVHDWSLSWNGGITLDGMQFFDAQNRQVGQIGELRSPISLMNVLRGKLDFGDTVIRKGDFFIEWDEQNQLDFADVLKPDALQAVRKALHHGSGALRIIQTEGDLVNHGDAGSWWIEVDELKVLVLRPNGASPRLLMTCSLSTQGATPEDVRVTGLLAAGGLTVESTGRRFAQDALSRAGPGVRSLVREVRVQTAATEKSFQD